MLGCREAVGFSGASPKPNFNHFDVAMTVPGLMLQVQPSLEVLHRSPTSRETCDQNISKLPQKMFKNIRGEREKYGKIMKNPMLKLYKF